MDIKTYTKLALQTEQTPRMTVTYDNGDVVELNARQVHALIGGASEIGEGLDPLKKFIVYREPMKRSNLIEEAGDKLWYLTLELDSLGSSLEEAMRANIAKLEKRFGGKFSYEAAHVENRDLVAETKALEDNIGSTTGRKATAQTAKDLMVWYNVNRQAGHTTLMLTGLCRWLRDLAHGERPVAVLCVDQPHARHLGRKLEDMLAGSNQESLVNSRVIFVTINELHGHRMLGRGVMPMAVDNHTVATIARRWQSDRDALKQTEIQTEIQAQNVRSQLENSRAAVRRLHAKVDRAARVLYERFNPPEGAIYQSTVDLCVADARSHVKAEQPDAGVSASAATIVYLADRVTFLEAQEVKLAAILGVELLDDHAEFLIAEQERKLGGEGG